MKKIHVHPLPITLVLWLSAILLAHAGESVVNSPHDLSAGGPGTIRAQSETEICIFCHTPHGASTDAPLWNRYDTTGSYIPYSSSSLKASVGQPTGASKLCLSCHDGTVALGMLRNRTTPIQMASGITHMPPGPAMLGKDLSDDHPISFTYDAALAQQQGELKNPATLSPDIKLDINQQLQCTACHDPHDNQFGKFMVMETTGGALCLECHRPDGWDASSHALSTATWNGNDTNPWAHSDETTVQANACANCHRTHGAGQPRQLQVFAEEEDNCLTCHNGNVAQTDIAREFRKFSIHDIFLTRGVHDPVEHTTDAPRHVECVDCHNPHAMQAGDTAGGLSGALLNVPGVSSSGSPVAEIQTESELCYRCHSDFQNLAEVLLLRQFPENNVRREFLTTNASYHPVESSGRNPNVPSLIQPWSEASTISCTDCHNNDQGPGAGGTGPRGPHGSIYKPLLERRLEFEDGLGENAATYALCYKCHSRDSILANESFPGHFSHVSLRNIACTTCHDAHGVESATHLINFNLEIVGAFNGTLEYVDNGPTASTCTLMCHSKEHDALSYETPLLPFAPR
ncbi:MAG: putative CXXCH cytochrome family protein [Kiritimatiellia bacterium]|jgi:predicted CXXCH cytochrome family protein